MDCVTMAAHNLVPLQEQPEFLPLEVIFIAQVPKINLHHQKRLWTTISDWWQDSLSATSLTQMLNLSSTIFFKTPVNSDCS